DKLVTGVQTCALPIFFRPVPHFFPLFRRQPAPGHAQGVLGGGPGWVLSETGEPVHLWRELVPERLGNLPASHALIFPWIWREERSEERRVGKEGGGRG